MQSFNREDYIHRLEKEKAKLVKQLDKAKYIIKNIIRVTYGEGWNYSLQVKVEAEKFLKESEQ